MSYVNSSDLYNYIAGFKSDNSRIRAEEVSEIASAVCSEIDLSINHLYELPITTAKAPKSFLVLKMIAIDLAREKVAQRLDMQTYDPELKQNMAWYQAVKDSREKLNLIRDSKLPLSDAKKCGADCGAFNSGSYDDLCDLPGVELALQFSTWTKLNKRQLKRFEKAIKTLATEIDDLRTPLNEIAERYWKSRQYIFDPSRSPNTSTGRWGQWRDLKPATKKEKYRLFGSAYPILLRTGTLKDSLARGGEGNITKVEKTSLQLGTTVPYAGYHQFGTKKMDETVSFLGA